MTPTTLPAPPDECVDYCDRCDGTGGRRCACEGTGLGPVSGAILGSYERTRAVLREINIDLSGHVFHGLRSAKPLGSVARGIGRELRQYAQKLLDAADELDPAPEDVIDVEEVSNAAE